MATKRRLKNPNQMLTPEAREHLNQQGIDPEQDTDSADEYPTYDPNGTNSAWFADAAAASENLFGSPEESSDSGDTKPDLAPGDAIDNELSPADKKPKPEIGKASAGDSKPLIDPEKPIRGDVKTTPPDKDEWLDFFSRVILKVGLESYADFAFRGIDENLVDAKDLERIRVRKDERDAIARPFAAYATKNKWTRKHGREIVSAADSIESLITLGIWMRRVNRIAKKYRPQKATKTVSGTVLRREHDHGHSGPTEGNGSYTNGRIPDGVIINPGTG